MKPHKLTLTGFIGIRRGLGRDTVTLDLTTIPEEHQLVAIVGANGNGKTTILDNLHPYRLMPSRSSTLGPGGFSFWSHLYGPSAEKHLEWEHNSLQYKTVFHFKVSGKTQKGSYYLFQLSANGEWEPFVSADGVVSDGSANSYDRCVNEILGIPERFFTSQFSAQKRKALSEYDTSDIKALLASILNMGQYRALSTKANAVVRLLRADLEEMQEQLTQGRIATDGIASAEAELGRLALREVELASARKSAEEDLSRVQHQRAEVQAIREATLKVQEEANFLRQQIEQSTATHRKAISQLESDAAERRRSFEGELARLASEGKEALAAIEQHKRALSNHQSTLDGEEAIVEANRQLVLKQKELAELEVATAALQQRLQTMRPLQKELSALMDERSLLDATGKAKVVRIATLQESSSLVQNVPCHGSTLQQSCPLLANAVEAGKALEVEGVELATLRQDYARVHAKVKELDRQVADVSVIEEELQRQTVVRQSLSADVQALSDAPARLEKLQQARAGIPDAAAAIERLAHRYSAVEVRQREVQSEIEKIQQQLATSIENAKQLHNKTSSAWQLRLDSLPKPLAQRELEAAEQEVTKAQTALQAIDRLDRELSSQKVSALARLEIHRATQTKCAEVQQAAARLSDEIAKFKLLEKGLGNDGLIALSIDDAGPEISRLCNELLREDYEGRFAVRLDTQRETLGGDLRETFSIKVFDSRGGDPTSLDDMSGGEQVWVNECLTRAIALYVSSTTGTRYQTLFTDEADGALDPSRKRQFIQMKLAVLKRGGYEREYFISQTPELWELAHHVIRVDQI